MSQEIDNETPIPPASEDGNDISLENPIITTNNDDDDDDDNNNNKMPLSQPQPQQQQQEKQEGNWKLRIGLLGMLSAQFASHTILVRYSRAVLHESYNPAAVVLLTEVLKVATCVVALTFFKNTATADSAPSAAGDGSAEGEAEKKSGVKRISQIIQNTPPPMLIPATSFFIQNVLAFVALKHLPPSVFVILSQLKIVFTTIFSVILLSK